MAASQSDAVSRPASPTRGLSVAFLADRGFAAPEDAAIDRHYRRQLPGGLTAEVFLTEKPRVVVFRGRRRFEAKVGTETELDDLLEILGA